MGMKLQIINFILNKALISQTEVNVYFSLKLALIRQYIIFPSFYVNVPFIHPLFD